MSAAINEKEEEYKNPDEDSIVTSNHLGGKKEDADPASEKDKPVDEGNLVTQESQKSKKVDADPGNENERP